MGAIAMGILLARLISVYTGCILKRRHWLSGAFRNRLRYLSIRVWVLFALSISLVACSSDPQLTPDSRILINPTAFQFEIEEFKDPNGICVFSPEIYQDVPVSLVVVDSSDRALGDTLVTVYLDFAANTFSGAESLQLFFDTNGNGVVDTPDELVSGIGDDAFSIRTDKYTASTLLLLRVNLSCGYRGSLYAFSGPAAGVINIDVVAADSADDEFDTLLE